MVGITLTIYNSVTLKYSGRCQAKIRIETFVCLIIGIDWSIMNLKSHPALNDGPTSSNMSSRFGPISIYASSNAKLDQA